MCVMSPNFPLQLHNVDEKFEWHSFENTNMFVINKNILELLWLKSFNELSEFKAYKLRIISKLHLFLIKFLNWQQD